VSIFRLIGLCLLLALASSPTNASGVNRFKAALEAQSKGDLDHALTLYTQAMRDGDLSHKQLSISSYNRGIIFLSKKSYDLAISDFDTAIWLRPKYSDAYHNRGLAHNRAGNFKQSIADFTVSLELKPDNPSALNNRGNAYRAVNEFDKAIADYDKAIALQPEYGFGYYNRDLALEAKAISMENVGMRNISQSQGGALRRKALWAGARRDFEKALHFIPDHPAIKAKLAQTPK
jgi:tetratricopeptide (TPR) repeat protein